MKFVTANRVTVANAISYFGTVPTHTNSLYGVKYPDGTTAFATTPPEIIETARALQNNPDTIFEFVHNQIRPEFAFGERKGPLGALIDKSGTSFDQNVLFGDLVSQAGYPVQYQIGQVTIQAADFANWTGVTDIGAACQMLASGGIAAVFTPSIPGSCAGSGSFTSVNILHIWTQVNIGGTWYAYDPSFKVMAGPAPVNLSSASGIVAGAAATAAETGMDSGSSSGVKYIHNLSQPTLNAYITARGTQLLAYLKKHAPTLDTDQVAGVTKIQPTYAPVGRWRNSTPPGYTTGTSVTVAACSAPQTTATYSCDIPDQYRTQLQVSMTVAPDLMNYVPALNWTFFADDIDGRRLAIATNFNDTGGKDGGSINPASVAAGGTVTPVNYLSGANYLTVDDVVVQSWSCTISYNPGTFCYGAQSPGQVTLTATHPYPHDASSKATFADETVTKPLTATATPVTIVSGWGLISPDRLAKWSDEVADDSALPSGGVPPWVCGNEGGGVYDYCFPPYAQSTADLTRQKLAASWLAEMTRMMQLQATIGGATVEHQHSIGIIDWRHMIQGNQFPPSPASGPNYLGVVDQFTDLNIDTIASITSTTDNAPSVAAISRSVALASATLEGSVLEQMQDLPDTASTAARFAWGNDPGADNQTNDMEDPCWTTNNPRRFFDFTGTDSGTRAGLYLYEGYAPTTGAPTCSAAPASYLPTQQQSTFTGAAESAIASYLARGATTHVTASAETYLGPGARFSTCTGTNPTPILCNASVQRGDALVATTFDASGNVLQVAHVLTSVWGISKGGGGDQPEHFAQYDPAKAGDALKDRFVDRSVALGVDLKSGTVGYSTPTLISTGVGSAPYKLDYSMSFKAAPTGCNDYGPCTGPLQGGWNHSWDVRFTNSGSGEEALGATSPFAAAGTLAAFLVMQDVYAETSLANLNQDVIAALAGDWWRQQMIANTATLNKGFSGQQYVRLVDATWMAPIGAPGVLTQSGSRVKVRDQCHSFAGGWELSTSRRWDHSAVSFLLRNAGGDTVSVAPWSWNYDPNNDDNCAKADGYQLTTWAWPQGVQLSFTYGTPFNGQTDYTPGVTAITSSLGRSMTFTSGADDTVLEPVFTATTNGVTVGEQLNGMGVVAGIADAVAAPSPGGGSGLLWQITYAPVRGRSSTLRPVPYPELHQVFNPISSTLPALQYTYDTRGLVKTGFDANGLQVAANAGLPAYNWFLALGGRGERDDPDGDAYAVYYDTDGNEVRNIDEIDREVDSTWDGRHRVVSRTFPEGDQELFAYDGTYSVHCSVGVNVNCLPYDDVTSLTKVAKPGSGLANIVIQANYDSLVPNAADNLTWNKLVSITDAMSNETDFTYYPSSGCGTSGAESSMMCMGQRPAVNGTRPTFTYQYDGIGLATQSVDPTGVTTTHGYDSYGNLTSTTEGAAAVGSNPALNLTTNFTPDTWGNVIATSDPLSHTSNQTYDLDRRVLLSIAPNPGTGARPATLTTYDANGRPYQVDKGTTNASGATFTATETTTTAFDPNGNKNQVSVLNGTAGTAPLSVTQINYDALNRVICTAGRENSAVFSALPDACTQSAGGAYGPDPITMIGYDLAGQELTETRGWGTPLAQAYTTTNWGQDGEKLSVLDANGNRIHFAYDGFNRLNLITHPDHTTEASVYDPDGDLVIWTNRGGFGVVRCYDVLNRKTSESGITGASLSGACASGGTTNINTRTWDIQPRTFTYDLSGRLTGANIPNYPLSYAYDAAGRPTSRGASWSAGYGWDNAGNLNALTYPDGTTVVTYQYDPLNRTTKALIGGQSYGALSYDALGRRQTLTFQDGSTQTWNYDNADRVISIAHVFQNDTPDNVTFGYGYDPSGRDATRTLTNSAYAYVPSAASTTYGAANNLNQYPSVGGYSYSYWPEGELNQTDTQQTNYDELGAMIEAYITVTPGVVDPANGEYVGIDALGHKYFHERQTVAGQTYPFIYHSTDGLRPETIYEWQYQALNGAPQTLTGTRLYVLGPDPDERWAYVGLNGGILGPHTDREGTLIALASGGHANNIYAYDAYGQNASPASDTVPGAQSYLYRSPARGWTPTPASTTTRRGSIPRSWAGSTSPTRRGWIRGRTFMSMRGMSRPTLETPAGLASKTYVSVRPQSLLLFVQQIPAAEDFSAPFWAEWQEAVRPP